MACQEFAPPLLPPPKPLLSSHLPIITPGQRLTSTTAAATPLPRPEMISRLTGIDHRSPPPTLPNCKTVKIRLFLDRLHDTNHAAYLAVSRAINAHSRGRTDVVAMIRDVYDVLCLARLRAEWAAFVAFLPEHWRSVDLEAIIKPGAETRRLLAPHRGHRQRHVRRATNGADAAQSRPASAARGRASRADAARPPGPSPGAPTQPPPATQRDHESARPARRPAIAAIAHPDLAQHLRVARRRRVETGRVDIAALVGPLWAWAGVAPGTVVAWSACLFPRAGSGAVAVGMAKKTPGAVKKTPGGKRKRTRREDKAADGLRRRAMAGQARMTDSLRARRSSDGGGKVNEGRG